MRIDSKKIEESAELKALHSTLSKVKYVAMNIVRNAQDETDAINRASEIESKLRTLFGQAPDGECPHGTVYNPVTGNCE